MKEVKDPRKDWVKYYIIVLLVMLVFNAVIYPRIQEASVKEVSYNVFMDLTEQQKIDKVQVDPNQILFTEKDSKTVYKTGIMDDPNLTERLYKAGVDFRTDIQRVSSPLETFLFSWVIPILMFVVLGQFMSRKLSGKIGGGANSMMFGMGKSNAKIYVHSTEGISFDDVAGEDEAKESLQEIVTYLKDPGKYTEIGAKMPKGILLVGPPGTGKTMLAKAVAGESNVPFFSISGSEFVEMFVGMGASKVRDLFDQAKEKAPCIVFIDEIDAIGQKRNSGAYGGNDEREQTLNQLLTEMDGFEGNNGVIILAATNRPESLDPALLRPGRFDRRIPVELPDLKGREEILKVHAKKVRLSDNVNLHTIARMASGASGAELANIINEAALRAVRAGRKVANQQDLEESVETVIAGYQKKNAVLTDKEKCTVAYHEIGHALVSALQSHSAPVQKITIIPRTSGRPGLHTSGGGTGQVPADKGRAPGEDLHLHRGTCGGGSDLRRHHHWCLQRHRAGHQDRPGHDHYVRHGRRVRHGAACGEKQPVSWRRDFHHVFREDPGGSGRQSDRTGEAAVRKGEGAAHGEQRQAERAGAVPV